LSVAVERRRFLAAAASAMATPILGAFGRNASAAPLDPSPFRKPLEDATPSVVSAPSLPDPASEPRTQVLFVVIDRPQDAGPPDHAPNLRGLRAAVNVFDSALRVTAVTIGDLAELDAAGLDATYRPLAIVGAGSFTEWFQYGLDAEWKSRLDHWMSIIRTTTVPMLAICGSHQLVAMAFNGFGAVAHMTSSGPPVRILDELSVSTPRGMWPTPRVGEEGTYPIATTAAAASDPLVRAIETAPMASAHHKDMVVDTSGFVLLYQGDDSRPPATRASEQAQLRCRVQAMRRDDRSRLLYTSQFHPEMSAFDESTASDRGFGATWVGAFLTLSRTWWSERSGHL
jgi:GMP synthase-like glutamine amidotransferase